ncbi:MAG: hypothetical protein HYZ90_04440, partial [Candidatus Omnitrophica bacterium]|nr:hypothetical protein [Candidatus Omnitrophota bacterium]
MKAFLFDLGNVLVQFDHRVAARKIAADTGLQEQELHRFLFESPLIAAHDAGQITTQRFHEELKGELGLSVGYEQFLSIWSDIFAP